MTEVISSERPMTIFFDQSAVVRHYSFAPTAPSVQRPQLIENGDLRAAYKSSNSLSPDAHGRAPMPILLVDSVSVDGGAPNAGSQAEAGSTIRAVRARPHSRAIASLLLDCALLGLAEGAIVVIDPEVTSESTLLQEVSRLLQAKGIMVKTGIEGWALRVLSGPEDCDEE